MLVYILYCIFFNLGVDFGSKPYYDLYRVIQIFLTLLAIFILLKKINFSKFTHFIFSVILIAIIFLLKDFDIFQIQDLLMWLILSLTFLFLRYTYLESKLNIYSLWSLGFLSTIPCFFIILSIFFLFKDNHWYDWHLDGASLRVYDSVLVCNFWLLTYIYTKKNLIVNKIYYFILFFIFLGVFFDGARSALLSIFIPSIYFSLQKNYRKQFLKMLIVAISALIFYVSVNYLYSSLNSSTRKIIEINRYSSSGRSEMWMFMFHEWLKQPISGIGGGYLAKIDYKIAHHSHNVIFRLIFEWGTIGILLLIWLLVKLKALFYSNVNIVLKLSVVGILIDSFFSGFFIYPVSQVMGVIILAIAFSHMEVKEKLSLKFELYTKILILMWMSLFFYIAIHYFYNDLICFSCSSETGSSWPFFWQYGSSSHLSKK